MPDTLNPEIADGIATTNLITIAEQPAILSNLALANLIANCNLAQQNAIANQQAMNELGISVVGKCVNLITNIGPLEARSATDILTGNEVAEAIADLKAAIQSFQNPPKS